MKLSKFAIQWLEKNVVDKREPDVYIGGREEPYLLRWHVLPRNPVFNVYYHHFMRSDFSEALHDHPWLFNASWLLEGSYTEHTFEKPTHRGSRMKFYQAAQPPRKIERIGSSPPEFIHIDGTPEIEVLEPLPKKIATRVEAGAFKWRWGVSPHRIELDPQRHHGDTMPPFVRGRFYGHVTEEPVKTLFITGPKVRRWGFYCVRAWKHWKQFLSHYGSAHEGLHNKGCR